MSITTVDAKVYISRILGGAQSPMLIDQAGEALLRGYADWQIMRNWDFLLKDDSMPTVVTGVTATSGQSTVNAPTSGAFDFVNAGQSVTVTGNATLAPGTTILSYTRNTDGTVASFILTAPFGGSTDTNATLTFGANIHITAGVNDYSLPNDCHEIYTARFLTNSKRPLKYIRQRQWDRVQWDQTIQGTPEAYTQYNPYAEVTQNHGTQHIKFDRIPQQADDLFVRYYRTFNKTGTYVDVHDKFLYPFLDYCRAILLEAKRAQENPMAYLEGVKMKTQEAGESEEEVEDDEDNYMKSAYEQGTQYRPIVGNGDFWPTMGS
jgi:hypothetical protein